MTLLKIIFKDQSPPPPPNDFMIHKIFIKPYYVKICLEK